MIQKFLMHLVLVSLGECCMFRCLRYQFFSRRNVGVVNLYKVQLSSETVKRANLTSRKTERIKLPKYDDIRGTKNTFHISEFLSHPSGIESILNTSALQSYYSLDSNTYRLTSHHVLFILHDCFNFSLTL